MPLDLSTSATLTLRKRIAASDAGERRVLSSEDSMMMLNGRSAKPWGSFREGAANLHKAASDSRISKATRVIMLASFSLMTMTRMEVAVADPIVTQQVFQVEHVKIEATKKFAEIEAALDASIPPLDPAIGAALTNGKEKHAGGTRFRGIPALAKTT